MIADLNVVETLEADTTFISLPNFSYILFSNAQGTHVTFIDDVSAAIEADPGISAQLSIGNTAARYSTRLPAAC